MKTIHSFVLAFLAMAAMPGLSETNSPPSMAERYPPRAEDLRPTPGWAPEFRRDAARGGRVPLKVDWADNELTESMVTFGVPFARGALKDASKVRIVADSGEASPKARHSGGQAVPAEFRVVATWDGTNGPVRWALAHARLCKGQDYFLEYGPDVKADPPAGIEIKESDKTIEINTGPMRVTLSRETASIVESAALDLDGDRKFSAGEELVGAEKSRAELPAVVDDAGVSFFAGDSANGFKMEVVERGPQRAAVRREGWYVDKAGNKFCRFITYTYFYAGQAGMRHDHTLVVAFDSNKQKIRDIMLPIPLNLDKGAQSIFAVDNTNSNTPVELPASGGPYSLVQGKLDAWELSGKSGVIKSGARAGGWFGLSDGRRGAFAGISDFWQQYPSELETSGNVLRLHLWPARHPALLDFRPSAQMGADYPGNHVLSGQWYKDGLDEMTQAYGLGKTHNIYVNFFAAAMREDAWRRERAQVCRPVIAAPDPKWVCDQDVLFGRVHPYDPGNFPEIEAQIDSIVDSYYRVREEKSQYGWINFGDVYNTGRLWRRWASMFYGFPNLMPRLYLRSGRRDAWDFHRVNTRHVTDIDICHLDNPGFRKEKGRRYGGDGCICHYAADLYKTGPDTHLDFMLMDYYLNGNLRTWEVANEYLRAHAAARDKDAAMLTYSHRSTGGALRLFCEAYLATWDPEYLSIMRQLADILYKAREELGVTRRDDVYMNPGKILYYQITGEERMRDLFLNDMTALSKQRDVHVIADTRAATLSGLAHAWWFTGDEKFLPFFRWQLDIPLERGVTNIPGLWVAIAATYGSQLPEAMAVLSQVKKLPEPLGPALPEAAANPLALKSNWAFYMQETNDVPFSLTVNVDLYRDNKDSFPNWREWVEQLSGAEKPALLVIDPAGAEIKRVELTPDSIKKPLKLDFPPDGKTGTYTLVSSGTPAPVSLHLAKCTLEKRVAHVGENWISGKVNRLLQQRSYYFTVPAGTGEFEVGVKAMILRGRAHFGVANAEGKMLAESEREIGTQPRNDWETFKLDAGKPGKNEVWCVTLNEACETYLRFTGVPNCVASSPEELFIPGPAARREMPPVEIPPGEGSARYAEAGLPWGGQAASKAGHSGGQAAYLSKEVALALPGGGKIFDEKQGTVEMWLKTADSGSALADKGLLRCGKFSLFRRINLGTYVTLGEYRMQRFFILPNNRWTHLAFTWRPADEGNGGLEIKLFADGIEIGSTGISASLVPRDKVPAEWAGDKLIVPAGLFVSNLRVSGSVRYENNFRRPEAPFESDEHTRALCRFDGSGEMWVAGKKIPMP
ncbi:MAG: hypothetical protein WC299_13110 [Kiritimatiellia bacterium]